MYEGKCITDTHMKITASLLPSSGRMGYYKRDCSVFSSTQDFNTFLIHSRASTKKRKEKRKESVCISHTVRAFTAPKRCFTSSFFFSFI